MLLRKAGCVMLYGRRPKCSLNMYESKVLNPRRDLKFSQREYWDVLVCECTAGSRRFVMG